MTDSRLCLLHMIYIYYKKLDETDIKLITINWRSPEFLLLGCVNLEQLFARSLIVTENLKELLPIYLYLAVSFPTSNSAFTCSKLTIETLG